MGKLNFDAIFDKWDADNQKTWEFDRDESAGASSVWGCYRGLFFDKDKNTEKDTTYEYSWGAFARGNLLEDDYVVPAMFNALDSGMFGDDVTLIGAGEHQKTFVSGRLSATPDGLIIGLDRDALSEYGIPDIKSGEVVFEIKSIDPRVNLDGEKEVHHGQTQVQMGIIRETTEFQPEYAIILYIDCSFFDEMQVYIVKYNEKMYQDAKVRANAVFAKGAKASDFRAEGRIDGGCKFCDYTQACAEAIHGSIPEDEGAALSDEDSERATMLITEVDNLAKQVKSITKEHKTKKADLSEFLKENSTRILKSPNYSVSVSWNKGKSSLDSDGLREDMKEAGLDLDDYYTTGNGYEVLRVSVKKPKAKK